MIDKVQKEGSDSSVEEVHLWKKFIVVFQVMIRLKSNTSTPGIFLLKLLHKQSSEF